MIIDKCGYYLTNDETIIYVNYIVDKLDGFPVHGELEGELCQWTNEGRYSPYGEHKYDLVEYLGQNYPGKITDEDR